MAGTLELVLSKLESTVPLWKSKLFISRSFPILVLTTVLCRSRRADAKKDVKNYQGPKKKRSLAVFKTPKFPPYVFF